MKNATTLVLLLFLTAPLASAQECPTYEALPASVQAVFSTNKHVASANAYAVLAASALSADEKRTCIAGESARAAEKISADGPFYSSIDELWINDAWEPASKSEYEYNEDFRLTDNVFFRWNAATQDFREQTARYYTYDANGNLAELLTQTWLGGTFVNQYLSVSERDDFGNQTRLERSDWLNGAWQTRFLAEAVVVDGLITERTTQSFNSDGTLNNSQFFTFTHDTEGRVTVELQEQWNENTQSWEPAARDLTSYGDMTEVTRYQVIRDGDWVDATVTTTTYNDQGQELEVAIVGMIDDIRGNRFLFSYNDAGYLLGIISQAGDGAGGWINESRQSAVLDEDGDTQVLLIEQYEGNAWVNLARSTFSYEPNETATGVEDALPGGVTSFDIYPYPAQDKVNVELQLSQAADIQIEVFDILGRRVEALATGAVPSGVQQFSWLPNNATAGLYFVRLSVDGAVETKPIMLVK